jgi:hypothetical protein
MHGVAVVVLAFASVGLAADKPAATTRPVRLLAVGDMGTGGTKQYECGRAMAAYADRHPAAGVLMAGDLFYVRPTSADDPLFQTAFEKPYDFDSLRIPFYAAPGNHDYEPGKLAFELEYAKSHKTRFTMPATYHRVDLPKGAPQVTVLMLNSNQPKMTPDEWAEETAWLEAQLKDVAGKRWVVACFHHPLYSNGNHGDNGVMQRTWGPLFDKYKVDLVVAGHDHDLQHLEVAPHFPSFVMVGGGGAGTRPMRVDARGPFSKRTFGFGALEFTPERLTVSIVDPDLNDLHTFTRTRAGKVKIVSTTPNDRATTRTVKSVTRDDKERD